MKNIFFITSVFLIFLFTSCNSNTTQEISIVDKQIYEQAINGNNLELCTTIKNENYKSECQEIIESNETLKQATDSKNIEKCGEIKNKQIKEACRIQIKDELNKEEESKNAEAKRQQETELGKEAFKKSDLKLCDKIDDENSQYNCRYNIIANQALEKNDPKVCEEIGRSDFIETCQKNLKNKKSTPPSL